VVGHRERDAPTACPRVIAGRADHRHLGDGAVVGNRGPSTPTATRSTTRSSGWTPVARSRSRLWSVGRVKVAGYEPRKLRTFIPPHRRRPCAPRARIPSPTSSGCSRASRCRPCDLEVLEPKDWLNLSSRERAAAHLRLDRDALAHRQPRPCAHRVRARAARARRYRSGSTARPDRRTEVLARFAPRPLRSWGFLPASRSWGALPISSRLAVGSGRWATSKAICTSYVVVAHLSRALQETGRATRSGVAAVAAARKYLRGRRAGDGGARASTTYVTASSIPTMRSARPAPGRRVPPLRRARRDRARGSHRVIFTPWLNGERTPVDDQHGARGMDEPVALDQPCRSRSVDARRCRMNSRWLLGAVERFVAPAVPMVEPPSAVAAASDLWCQIHADVLNRPIRQVEHPIRANARGAA